ncbi:hypothetical protein CGSHi22121_01810 [Haemophilus influenzae 22.1-21]|nr:hypothetical protein CGSHi22121_01810 [Haemophilus influenzae 22.1-21]
MLPKRRRRDGWE